MANVIGILGGDLRSVYLANALAHSFEVHVFYLEGRYPFDPQVHLEGGEQSLLARCPAVVLPVPVCQRGLWLNAPLWKGEVPLSVCLEGLPAGTKVFGGGITGVIRTMAGKGKLELTELLDQEELTVRNALPTAEGALEIALRETDRTIRGSKCLVVGYGRIGRLLCGILRALGAEVTAACRGTEELAWAETEGCQTLPMEELQSAAQWVDIAFNTAPAQVLTEAFISGMRPDGVIIDLASLPGGTDFEAARVRGIKAIHGLGLPGKCAPRTAGEAIARTVEKLLRKER
ncbi:dipicolinate synthase subunit DpsA [Angelakisella massiliensis]|uniref:dipicolinate synthase subunit DpsA n=1 Tax=Angelakisella massiliensis TaxID=1871018 RepID=UPI0008F80662|nr:dipicolinate synthase subunit DpsA [Angelakisella massiliensis]